ncbi:hypothetical protein G5V59_22195 [Nocardioides sp. W3-2-3]|uniref:hypothetical protein n=1 Tax=Nocardioides convexus TaxID=2712224 RepID=UPI002418A048|nr:hypothetical protein [Nocardioides convexus]NHA01578.1 hypothetical protein [Nocardioides convexus]
MIGTVLAAGGGYTPTRWTVDTSTLTVTGQATLEVSNAADVASDATGSYLAATGTGGGQVVLPGGGTVALGQDSAPSRIALLPSGSSTDVVVAGVDWQDGGTHSVATLRTVHDGTSGAPVTLGAEGTPDQWVTGLAVDPVHDLTYVVSGRDVSDGPQEYGLNVIGAGTDLYVPLSSPVFTLGVSPDGGTVYLPGTGVSAYDASALTSYTDDNPAPSAYLGGSGFISLADVAPSGRVYAVQDVDTPDGAKTQVHALEAPGAPSGLTVAPSEWDDSTYVATWTAPASAGGADPTSLTYRTTLQDQAGGDPVTFDGFLLEQDLGAVTPGHTYTVSVTATNGVFTSAPATATLTPAAPVAHPSAVAVSGRAAVGTRLAVASTGSWAAGTTLAYTWRTDTGLVVARTATYTPTPGALGRRLQVEVTGTKAGLAPATVTSAPSAKVVAGTLVAPVPSVSGTAKVARTLTATAGTWTAGTRLTYRWTANGVAIAGATARTFKPTRAQVGKQAAGRRHRHQGGLHHRRAHQPPDGEGRPLTAVTCDPGRPPP